jgi:putative sterol carrier protein
MTGLFTNDWATAWGEALNRSAAYQAAGKHWEGALVLEAQADAARGLPATASVWLDLWRGTCREARLATVDDLDQARYVITGPLVVWLTVLSGDMAPTMAIVRGHLTLLRGSLLGLMPHVHAATELVRVAQQVTGGRLAP